MVSQCLSSVKFHSITRVSWVPQGHNTPWVLCSPAVSPWPLSVPVAPWLQEWVAGSSCPAGSWRRSSRDCVQTVPWPLLCPCLALSLPQTWCLTCSKSLGVHGCSSLRKKTRRDSLATCCSSLCQVTLSPTAKPALSGREPGPCHPPSSLQSPALAVSMPKAQC